MAIKKKWVHSATNALKSQEGEMQRSETSFYLHSAAQSEGKKSFEKI